MAECLIPISRSGCLRYRQQVVQDELGWRPALVDFVAYSFSPALGAHLRARIRSVSLNVWGRRAHFFPGLASLTRLRRPASASEPRHPSLLSTLACASNFLP